MTGPIRPEDVAAQKQLRLPPEVFEVFNDLLVQRWNGYNAVIRQDEVVERLVAAGFDRAGIFGDHLLNVEPAYRAQGWRVAYDKPGYNETYPATFTFSLS